MAAPVVDVHRVPFISMGIFGAFSSEYFPASQLGQFGVWGTPASSQFPSTDGKTFVTTFFSLRRQLLGGFIGFVYDILLTTDCAFFSRGSQIPNFRSFFRSPSLQLFIVCFRFWYLSYIFKGVLFIYSCIGLPYHVFSSPLFSSI